MKKVIILLIGCISLIGCAKQELIKSARPYLDTIVEITVADDEKTSQFINDAIDKSFTEIERIEKR